jgi:hypothetical protein
LNEVDLEARNNIGDTVLHLAARDGDVDMVRTLLEKGADVTLENQWGETALEAVLRMAFVIYEDEPSYYLSSATADCDYVAHPHPHRRDSVGSWWTRDPYLSPTAADCVCVAHPCRRDSAGSRWRDPYLSPTATDCACLAQQRRSDSVGPRRGDRSYYY